MELMYSSTRNDKVKLTASQAILKGLADDGGLFVPERIPALDVPMDTLADMSYQETAYEVMSRFFTDFTEDELKDCIKKAYDSKFDTPEIAPLVDADGAYYLELFHGPTIAFKDMALSILPHLLITSARKNQVKNDIVILTATSGDTGKAALAGFADVEGTKIVVFYPKNGVSPIQEKQMITQKGANTCVVGIHGNFDQAQTGVKQMFSDPEMKEELLQAGIMNLALIRMPANKQSGRGSVKEFMYSLHPIFAPYFIYSFRRKRKMGLSDAEFLLCVDNPKKAVKDILDKRNIKISEEGVVMNQLYFDFWD